MTEHGDGAESPVRGGETGDDGRANLGATALDRYARQIVLREVGSEGQDRLREAAVLVVGAGGLGAPAIQYLAGAGVGTLSVADGDDIERSNLHRQPVHGEDDVGRSKAESARAFVAGLNPDVDVRVHDTVDPDGARGLVADHDLVLDCTDSFRARYLLNDACVLAGVPLVGGAVYRFEGQLVGVDAGGGPCYRCVFPAAPAPGVVPSCAEVGVLGAVPGVVGSMQTAEALKRLVGAGDPLAGELVVYDALAADVERVPFSARPDCPVCGEASIESLAAVTYEGTCAVSD